MVVRVGGPFGGGEWYAGEEKIVEKKETRYLGMKIVGGVQGGIRSLTGRVEMCHRVAGLVKFVAKRSGSRFLIGREGCKSGVVSRIMYGGGALVWKVEERNQLEKEQTAFGRWLWKAHPSVRNACIQAVSGWSTFSEREAKAKMGYVRKICVGGSMVAEVGRGVLLEMGLKSDW
ncbi:hypothetical protein CAPTEDRAFT_214777 [Capitella teleta]|uniref:Uncharacterized protein n=1 Tax=Capitella teleta TaxID=283909 RepID=R7UQ42_CAPTE|nr:hypothetical protein CAPTEDRAFT_214777 [Capitella teleta]|eukprot:ELU05536.1 hypothetical protein CAPTEDRAFT_214777 [Capitella teleta]